MMAAARCPRTSMFSAFWSTRSLSPARPVADGPSNRGKNMLVKVLQIGGVLFVAAWLTTAQAQDNFHMSATSESLDSGEAPPGSPSDIPDPSSHMKSTVRGGYD